MKEFIGRGLIAPDMEEIIALGVKRGGMLWEYRLKKKSKFGNKLKERIGKKWAKSRGKLHVIKAFRFDKVDDVEQTIDASRELYLLPDYKVTGIGFGISGGKFSIPCYLVNILLSSPGKIFISFF